MGQDHSSHLGIVSKLELVEDSNLSIYLIINHFKERNSQAVIILSRQQDFKKCLRLSAITETIKLHQALFLSDTQRDNSLFNWP